MIREQLQNLKNTKLLGAICGSLLLGLPFVPKVASAQPATGLEYCFDDFYQEPLNSMVRVPPGCPDNDYTREVGADEELETEASSRQMDMEMNSNTQPYNRSNRVGVIQPPMPTRQMRTMGSVDVDGRTVDVSLNNDTNAGVTYQVIGHTDDRLLYEGNETELLNLPLPVTITVLREDAGLIDIQDMMAENGEVQFRLQEEGDLTGSEKTIRIQEDGTVFVY
ncbi:hypothetical protein M595_3979 [Lyngbya aestuarii BL J]|uniref:Uncharacterized protein n=2 Tax=Lyngbya aestuarii TaxID=118322 RepID=U7QHZ8_9CYAN|nr:hypothetical protein M595_3979 [Lyngbya aestuarii BL J]